MDIFRTLQEFETGYSNLLGSHHLSIGYAYQRESVDDKHKDYTRDTQSLHGFYLQDEVELERLTFTLGGRFDYHDEWGTEFHPRGALYSRPLTNCAFVILPAQPLWLPPF